MCKYYYQILLHGKDASNVNKQSINQYIYNNLTTHQVWNQKT